MNLNPLGGTATTATAPRARGKPIKNITDNTCAVLRDHVIDFSCAGDCGDAAVSSSA